MKGKPERESPKILSGATLERAGKALYGSRWQTELGKSLGFDGRRVRQWMKKERPIPPNTSKKLERLLSERMKAIKEVLVEI
jgi:hypothetical protein